MPKILWILTVVVAAQSLFVIIALATAKPKWFPALLLAAVVILLHCITNALHPWQPNVPATIVNICLASEFLLLLFYIKKQLTKDMSSRTVLFIFQLFPLGVSFSWWYNNSLSSEAAYPLLFHALLITAGCLFFYDEIFEEPPDVPLARYPPFWIVNGIFILCCMLIPAALCHRLTAYNMLPGNMAPELQGAAYFSMYLFFIKALLCQISLKSVSR
jgi:hypothetical protein